MSILDGPRRRFRPGAFLTVALATGFVVGRLGKGIMSANGDTDSTSSSRSTEYVPTPATTPPPPVDRLASDPTLRGVR